MTEERDSTLLSVADTGIKHVGVVIPTYNASHHWTGTQEALEREGIKPEQVLIVDSSSTDDTRDLARSAGYRLMRIPKRSFRHGATRQMAAEMMPSSEILVFMTQDAKLFGTAPIQNLLRAFDDPQVGAAYGRQLPRPESDPIERHARLFSYTNLSEVRTLASRGYMGFRAATFSNSFAAYRRSAFDEVGGFPNDTIVSEEVTVAARMLLQDWKIAYRADATVIHSHRLSLVAEFSRYFDIGVHHGREPWLLQEFGGAGGEGRKFVISQMQYLAKTGPSWIPLAIIRNISKWCSYKLGAHESLLPNAIKRSLSGHPNFWSTDYIDGSDTKSTSPSAPTIQPERM